MSTENNTNAQSNNPLKSAAFSIGKFIYKFLPTKPIENLAKGAMTDIKQGKHNIETTADVYKSIVGTKHSNDELDDLLAKTDGHQQFIETMIVENISDEKYIELYNNTRKIAIGASVISAVVLCYLIWLIFNDTFSLSKLSAVIYFGFVVLFYFMMNKRFAEIKEQEFMSFSRYFDNGTNWYPTHNHYNKRISIEEYVKYKEKRQKETEQHQEQTKQSEQQDTNQTEFKL